MKSCSHCHEKKPESCFGRDRGKKDGLTSRCKLCKRKQERDYYNNPLTGRKKAYKSRKKRVIKENQKILYRYLESQHCLDCGEKDIVLLDFDHVGDDKVLAVSQMLLNGYSWNTIKKEIAKCDVVCANCHRLRTARRANWKIYNYSRGVIRNQEDS